jgi:membrane protease subunit HflK
MEEKIVKREEKSLGFVGDLLNTCVKYFKWIVLAIVLVILLSGIRTVQQGEVAVILRFGKLVGENREEQVHEPGLLFAFPYIIDEVITVPTGKVFDLTVDTHYTNGNMTGDVTKNGYCITGDHNIAVISTSLKYVINDPVRYALYNSSVNDTVRGVVSAAITEHVASVHIDSLLTDGKDDFVREVLSLAQESLDRLSCGVTLTNLDVSNIAPPAEVKTDFDNVNSATVSVQTALAEAQQYRETLLPSTQSSVDSMISGARVEQNKAVAQANALLAEFYGLLEEYETQPDVVILRVYHEKLAELYEKLGNRIVVDEGTPNIVLP